MNESARGVCPQAFAAFLGIFLCTFLLGDQLNKVNFRELLSKCINEGKLWLLGDRNH